MARDTLRRTSDAALAGVAAESEDLRRQLTGVERLYDEATAELAALKNPRSWTLTAPLRWNEHFRRHTPE